MGCLVSLNKFQAIKTVVCLPKNWVCMYWVLSDLIRTEQDMNYLRSEICLQELYHSISLFVGKQELVWQFVHCTADEKELSLFCSLHSLTNSHSSYQNVSFGYLSMWQEMSLKSFMYSSTPLNGHPRGNG